MNHKSTASSAFCQSVIAKDYYDGPMSGIGIRANDGALIFFRVVAWDAERWERIFAIASVNQALGDRLRANLVKVEPQPGDFWLPGPASNVPNVSSAWEDILRAALETQGWHIIEGHDLLGPVTEKALSSKEGERISEMVRQEVVAELQAAPMLDNFLQQIHTQIN